MTIVTSLGELPIHSHRSEPVGYLDDFGGSQIITTSHDLGPQMVVNSKGNPRLFHGNPGW